MKAALLVLALGFNGAPALAEPQITCEMVRAYVKHVGSVQAKAQARAAGMTAEQERTAKKCLAQKD